MSEIHEACRQVNCSERLYRYGFVLQRYRLVFRHRLVELVLKTPDEDAVASWLADQHEDSNG